MKRQGGDASFIEQPEKYPQSKYSQKINSPLSGYVTAIDSLELGFTGIALGAGRTKVDDLIDPKAGIVLTKKVGDAVHANDVVAILYTDNKNAIESSAQRIEKAFSIGPSKPNPSPLVISQVDKDGVKPFKP